MIWLADQTVIEVMVRAQKAARNSHSTVEIEKEPSSTLTSIFLVRKDGSRSLYRRFNTRLTGTEIAACIERAERKIMGI